MLDCRCLPIFFRLLLVAVFCQPILSPLVKAQTLGQEAAVFPFKVSALLADPVRARVYATVPGTNSVAVINTKKLKVIANVPIGANPQGMAISPDGNILYVANSASKSAAIGVLDLKTLSALPSLALPEGPRRVECGLDGRLYASAKKADDGIFQLDTVTGAVLTNITGEHESKARLQMSPDARTLYVFDGTLESFDVSTPTIRPLLRNHAGGVYVAPTDPVLNHTGQLIAQAYPRDKLEVNLIGIYGATQDLTDPFAILPFGVTPYTGPQAFSTDDTIFYEAANGLPGRLVAYAMNDFSIIADLPLFAANYDDSSGCNAIVVDRTDSYVFVGETGLGGNGELVAVSTGRGPLTAPSSGSVITLTAQSLPAPLAIGKQATFTITRSGGDLSKTLPVFFTFGGTAKDSDYAVNNDYDEVFAGYVVFQPSVTSFDIEVEARYNYALVTGRGVVTLTLTLAANPTYEIGAASEASLEINQVQ